MEDKTRPLAQNFDAKPLLGAKFSSSPPAATPRKLPEGATVLDFAFGSTPRWGPPARAARSITVRRRSATYSTTETSSPKR